MNIHIKTRGNTCEYDPALLDKIVSLIDKYDCRRYVYFMCGNDNFLRLAQERYPDVTRCCGAGDDRFGIVERAIRYDCKKVQLFLDGYSQEMIDKAHANGIRCNYFYCDDAGEAQKMLDMGVDTILTNDYQSIASALRRS